MPKLGSIIIVDVLFQTFTHCSAEIRFTVFLFRMFEEAMDLLYSIKRLELTNFNTVRKVNGDWLIHSFVFDFGLEDLDVHCSVCFFEILLEKLVACLSLHLLFVSCCLWNNTACMHLLPIHWVCIAEELEDVLAVEWISGGKIVA